MSSSQAAHASKMLSTLVQRVCKCMARANRNVASHLQNFDFCAFFEFLYKFCPAPCKKTWGKNAPFTKHAVATPHAHTSTSTLYL